MQFIQSFFTAVITIFLTLYFSRKYGLSDKDRSIVEKQFQIYNALYLNISKEMESQTKCKVNFNYA